MTSQLELFKVYTEEQEIQFQNKINELKDKYSKESALVERKRNLLLNNGFVEGNHFEFSNSWVKEEVEVTIGYCYNNSEESRMELLDVFEGYCNLRYKINNHSTKEVVITTTSFYLSKDKIECYHLTGNWRQLKPLTLLNKITNKNIQAEKIYQDSINKNDIKNYTLDKYKNLYPNADIKLDYEWSSNYKMSFELLRIKFPSGSELNLRINSQKDNETIWSRKDAVVNKMNIEQTLEYFNNQK